MNRHFFTAALVATLALAGCGSMSQVDQDGRTDEPIFPKATDVTFQTGSYPNLDDLARVRSGMTRDQLYALLGRPHFSEGFRVREWDYLFHFKTQEGTTACQFKVLFDKDRIARTFHWAPEGCASRAGVTALPK